ncbi:hypothetical protein MRB53_001287 [Persea americana]|uniref:Uncharacterized protein n=1 Tax=Persea americana TaxID=3435 RepID=A0ACC2MR98_PERAE|nr:hypothetical protein MRB53_001287 [Persea americana]
MESGQAEDTKDSSEESDRPQIIDDETGTGRFYECMFCKRGFSTAQALGGHMNIHRRDRARIRQQTPPSASSGSGSDPAYAGFTPQPLQNHRPYQTVPPPTNYHHVPTSTSSLQHSKAFYGDNSGLRMPPRPLSLFGEDLNVGPSAQVQPAQVKDGEDEKKDWEDDELDLELRLGHEP